MSRGISAEDSGLAVKLLAVIALMVAVIDQATKLLVLALISPGQEIVVIPGFFNLTLAFNPGAAFGLFADLGPLLRKVILFGATTVALLVVGYFLLRDYISDRLGQAAIGMILGGALGNIVDRLRLGEVVDFLDFYIGQYHWPAFNFADSCICIGVVVVLFHRPSQPKQVGSNKAP
jgi:signal peptidase II